MSEKKLSTTFRLLRALGFNYSEEAYGDEYYIDTICVSPKARGLGIGTKLLQFAELDKRNGSSY